MAMKKMEPCVVGRGEIHYWGYRVVGRSVPTGADDYEELFEVIEAYYDHDDNLVAWAKVDARGDTLEELRADLQRQIEAIEKPVIEERELPGGP